VVTPAELRRELGIKVGGELVVESDEGEVRMRSRRDGVRQAQAILGKYVRKGGSAAEELLADRRREAESE